MTNPNAVTFTDAEKAALSGQGNPYPEEKLELPKEESDAGQASDVTDPADGGDGNGPGSDKNVQPDGDDANTAKEAEEEGDGEEVEVVNKEGETRRKMIAFGAYEKKRIEANKAKEELSKLREQVAYLSGLSQNAKPATQPQQQTQQELSDTPPDKTKEPEKYLAWLEAAAQESIRIRRQSAQQNEQTTQFQQINQTVFEHEQAFINGDPAAEIEPHPDFHDAVKFLQDRHRAELQEAGYKTHEIQQIMAARAQSVALKALEAGVSPAQRVYSLAKLNGYKKAAPPKVETEAEKIARQAKNQEKAGKNISDLPGGESKGLTAEALANMDPMEFLKKWNSGEAKKVMNWNQ